MLKHLLKRTHLSSKIIIGRIGAPYGLKGWIKVHSFTDPNTNICHYTEGWLQYPAFDAWRPYQALIKQHNTAFILKFADCNNPETARKLTGALLAVERHALPSLQEDEYYWSDLEGLDVVTETGIALGIVDHFIATGANDVMLVKKDKKEQLIPYINGVIIKVDLEHRRLIVDWDPEF